MTECAAPPRPVVRVLLLGLGLAFVALGLVGVFLPILPTTPFLLVALWAFARSSRRFHGWLMANRLLGPYLKAWESGRVIPVRAKVLALTGMTGGMVYVTGFSPAPWYAAALMGAVCAYGAWFVMTKPSKPPVGAE